MLASLKSIRRQTPPTTAVPPPWLLNLDRLPCAWLLTMLTVNKKTQNHLGRIPNMESTLEHFAKCQYKTKINERSGFWQVDLTATA